MGTGRAITDRCLRHFGVDPRAFRALLWAVLQMDLRSQHYRRSTWAGDSKLFPPLFWVLAQNLFVSLVATLVLIGHADVLTFTTANLGVGMFLLACALVVEFHEVVLSPEDRDILAPLPLSPRTYAAVRLANLLGYTALMAASLHVCPAVAGAWLADASWLYVPVYLVAAAAATLFATAAVILAYLLLARFAGDRRMKDGLAFAQLGLTLAAIYGLQLLSRPEAGLFLEGLHTPPPWLGWTPPGWFACLVGLLSGTAADLHVPVLVGLAALLACSWLSFRLLSAHYALVQTTDMSAGQHAQARRPQLVLTPSSKLVRLLTGSREEAAACWLCWTMFRRDQDLQLRSYPCLGAAPGFFLLGWISGQLADPFDAATSAAEAAPSIVILYLLIFAVPLVAHQMTFSREYPAAWVLRTAPLRSPASFAQGQRQMIQFGLLLPLLLLMTAGFAVVWGNPLHAVVHGVAGFLLCLLAGDLTLLGVVQDLPFSRRYVRGEVSGSIALFVAALMAGATLIGLLQREAYQSPWTLAAFLAGLVVAHGLLAARARRVLARRFSFTFRDHLRET